MQSGIGTYTIPQIATPLYSKTNKLIDLMFANNLNYHVMSGYQFLMQNYKLGDRICIFGFSRGAYTARALAGMVHKVGVLPAGNDQQVPFAYKMFMKDDELGWKQSVLFVRAPIPMRIVLINFFLSFSPPGKQKKTFSIDVDISFVGVWDTVASVGLFPTFLPFTKSNTAIKTFRHALSLDEHRAKFKPSCYERITRGEAARGDWRAPVRRLGKVAGAGAGAKGKKGSAKEREEVAARGRSLTKKGSAVRDEAVEETLKKTLTKTTTMTTTTVTTTEEVQSQSQSQSSPKSASLPPGPSSSSSSPPPRPTKAPTFGAPSSSPTPASTSKPRAESSGSGSGSASRTRRLLGSLRRSARGAHDTVHGLVEPALKELGDMAMADRARSRSKSHSREKEDEKEQLSPDSERDKLEQMYLDRSRKTDVKEVWFAGVHCGESYYFHSYFSRVYAFAFRHSMDLSSFISSMTFFKNYQISAFCAFPTLYLFRASPLSTL